MKSIDVFSLEDINNIEKTSIKFPILFATEGDILKVFNILSISNLGPNTIMGLPETINIEKHTPYKLQTSGKYILVDAYKGLTKES